MAAVGECSHQAAQETVELGANDLVIFVSDGITESFDTGGLTMEASLPAAFAGLSDVKCQFAYGTDYREARQDVLNRIAAVNLPTGVKPGLSPWSPTGEIVRYDGISLQLILRVGGGGTY